MFQKASWNHQAKIISSVLEKAPEFDKGFRLPAKEFEARQKKVWDMLQREGADCGIVYSDAHYCGDVPYLAGNDNIIVEPMAAVLAKNGLYFITGLESGIVAEQYCHRSGAKIRKVDILKVDRPDYPADLLTPAQIIQEACGGKPQKVALLTHHGVFPLALYNAIRSYVGEANICDLSQEYYKIKYEKSDLEMQLTQESCRISDIMMEGMLRILRPGMCETQVAQWGYAIAHELGVEELGFRIMVTTGRNNRTIVGHASNTVIQEGDVVHIGVGPKRDGLHGAQRASVMCVRDPSQITPEYKVWTDFLEGAFVFGVEKFQEICRKGLPGYLHEQAMIDYYTRQVPALQKKLGIVLPENFSDLKGYVTTHNSGYTECQEGYGEFSLACQHPAAHQMVMMMDVGVKGYDTCWDDVVIPGLDYLVIEKTLGKTGNDVRVLNQLPLNLQYLVGEGFEA